MPQGFGSLRSATCVARWIARRPGEAASASRTLIGRWLIGRWLKGWMAARSARMARSSQFLERAAERGRAAARSASLVMRPAQRGAAMTLSGMARPAARVRPPASGFRRRGVCMGAAATTSAGGWCRMKRCARRIAATIAHRMNRFARTRHA
jgi:hypothetical protein